MIVAMSPFFFSVPLVIIPIALYGLVIGDVFVLMSTSRTATEIQL